MKIFWHIRNIIEYLNYFIYQITPKTFNLEEDEFVVSIISPKCKPYDSITYAMKYSDIQTIRYVKHPKKVVIKGKCEILKIKYDPIKPLKEYVEDYELTIDSSYKNFGYLKQALDMKIFKVSGKTA